MNGRLVLPRFDVAAAGLGGLGTLLAVLFVQRTGTALGLGLLLGLSAFVAVVLAYVAVPHVAVAFTIPLFAALPALKVFVHPLVGATKDLVAFAALTAAGVLFFRRRAARQPWIPDRFLLVIVGFLGALYVANVGGYLSGETGYGAAWFHGVRLFAEPLSLLLVGLSLREPQRTLRWAGASLLATGVAVALVGLAQQAFGIVRLVELGYDYGQEVREAYGYLRSFGTLPEPFSYAGFLLLGLAALLFWARRRPLVYAAAPIVVVGLAASFVRTAALVAVALLGLALAQRGHLRFAFLLVLAAVVAAATVFAVGSQQSSTRLVRVSPAQYLTLNGRTELWQDALGSERSNWVFGRGVGATGTASQRAQETFAGAESGDASSGGIVDSAYLATVADVGLVGLGLLLVLLLRLVVLSWRAATRGERSGWLALGLLTVMLLDALTRESLTGFPTAYVGMLVVGVALATWRRAEAAAPRVAGR
jgi:MYXO-CTERM domain-containing protein